MTLYYNENDNNYYDLKTKAIFINPCETINKDDVICFNIVSNMISPKINSYF